ncbi:hypothetical protein GOP47_0025163 [Adiantum capillus-veneris]|uniref:Uncharacterized protein n=1 Tax=Adiantum capillus-veneris TaxID=13818 RepID=A0A9D4Z384_ADICA|nr:hypothetical protein GOP47_0025163 [Adiantum capillus-veneris]
MATFSLYHHFCLATNPLADPWKLPTNCTERPSLINDPRPFTSLKCSPISACSSSSCLAALHRNPHVALSPPLHLGGFPLVEPSTCMPRPTLYYWLFSTIDRPQPMWEFPSVDGGLPLPSQQSGLPLAHD